MLEQATGLIEPDLLNAGMTAKPLAEQIVQFAEQVRQLTDQLSMLDEQLKELAQQVNKLGEDLDIADTVSNERLAQFSKQAESLDAIRKDAHNKLVAVVNSDSEQLKKAIDGFNRRFATSERESLEIGKRLDKVEAQQVKDQDAFIKSIALAVNTIKAEIDDIGLRMLRKPTDDVVSLRLTDGRDHRFREYRGSQGLRRPHRTTIDWISGDKYIDLSEPQD